MKGTKPAELREKSLEELERLQVGGVPIGDALRLADRGIDCRHLVVHDDALAGLIAAAAIEAAADLHLRELEDPRRVAGFPDAAERFVEDPVRMLRAVAMAARLDFAIAGITPNTASTLGGEEIAIVGHGFSRSATVLIGGIAARVTNISAPNVITAVVPAGLPVGTAGVAVDSGAATAIAAPGVSIYAPNGNDMTVC